jgi:hypothetical protein
MFHRTFEDNAPAIYFTAQWKEDAFGNFVPGQTVQIAYDPNRLPNERSTYNGAPTWSIVAFYQFSPDGPVQSKPLSMPAGPPPPRYSNDPAEATLMRTSIAIPEDAEELILWFLNSGRSGMDYWDSAYGANYVFRFTAIDIQGEEASVTSDPQTPYSGFNVSLSALPVVSDVTVNFDVVSNPPDQPFGGTFPMIAGALDESGRRPWSESGIPVPYGARVRFAFVYTVGGRTFVDDNDGTYFWAPKPLPLNEPAKFARMMAAR